MLNETNEFDDLLWLVIDAIVSDDSMAMMMRGGGEPEFSFRVSGIVSACVDSVKLQSARVDRQTNSALLSR